MQAVKFTVPLNPNFQPREVKGGLHVLETGNKAAL